MKNLIKKLTFTTILGVVSLTLGLINFFGLYKLPVEVSLTWKEHLGGFILSLSLIYVDEKQIKASLNRLFSRGVSRVDNELQGNKTDDTNL